MEVEDKKISEHAKVNIECVLTGLETSLLFFSLPLYPLLLLATSLLLRPRLQHELLPLRLLLLDLRLSRRSLLLELVASLRQDLLLASVVDVHHPRQPFLRLEVLLVSDLRVLDPGSLDGLERLAIGLLLDFVVLGEHGAFFLAVSTLDVIDTFGGDAETLLALLLFLLPLLDLESHEIVRVEVLDILSHQNDDQHF